MPLRGEKSMILRLWTRYKKPASDESKGVRHLCCRLMLGAARLLIVIKRTVRMVPSFPHHMRDLSMPGCHHPRKEHFEKMTMMSTAAPSMGMRSPQTTCVSLIASDRKNQSGLTPLMLPLMLRSMAATSPGLSCCRMSRSKALSPVSLPADGPNVASIAHAVAKDSMATALAIGNPTLGF